MAGVVEDSAAAAVAGLVDSEEAVVLVVADRDGAFEQTVIPSEARDLHVNWQCSTRKRVPARRFAPRNDKVTLWRK